MSLVIGRVKRNVATRIGKYVGQRALKSLGKKSDDRSQQGLLTQWDDKEDFSNDV